MHFQKIRTLTIASRVIASCIVFVGFLLYLKYGIVAGALASLVATVILMMFPGKAPQPKQNASIQDFIIRVFHVAAAFFFYDWVKEMPWFEMITDQLISRESMGNWHVILPVYLWCCAWCFSMIIKARAMTDEDILHIYQSDDPASSSLPS